RENLGRKTQHTFDRILESGQHLLGIVDDVLDFSKIEAGKLSLDDAEVASGTIIDRAVALTATRAFAKGLTFHVNESPDLPAGFRGDALRIVQVLVNLLSNAIKFTETGGVTLDAGLRDGSLVLAVADTGIGMDAGQVDRLFQPFEQADGSTTRRYGGTGLGLAITDRLVRLMGGGMRVESRHGAGSRFEVTLPLRSPTPPVPPGAPADATVGLAGLPAAEAAALSEAMARSGVVVAARGNGDAPDALLMIVSLAALGQPESGAAVAARRAAGRRVAVLITPGIDAPPSDPEFLILERPLRPRHVLDLLRGEAPESPSPAAGNRLAGISILAAEDNEVNRLVLQEILEPEGPRLVCVEDGEAALAVLERDGAAAYDIVVTDVQMPRIDGYELARRLRAMAPDLPVIGLTAHAMGEERERCRAAGMLDYLTKPVEIEALVAAIGHHARRPAGDGTPPPAPALPAAPEPAPAAAPAPEEAPTGAAPLIDWPGLLARYQGRPAFVGKLAATAVASLATKPGELRAAAADAEKLAFLAHGLKGAAGNLMASPVQALALKTELAAKSGDPGMRDLAMELAARVEELTAALRNPP
ncbi:MAG: response regulator, partial [Rhodocyclaceae bacterium]|nr:response regulator [Rhodocyclaceae bacterium]